jgi:MFS family permease
VTAQQYGGLVAIEMVTAMLCYIPVAHLADRHGRRPFVPATFVFFTLFPLSLLFARSLPWLAFACFVRGFKEFGEPARKALIIAEAPPDLRARTYGAAAGEETAATRGSHGHQTRWSGEAFSRARSAPIGS